MAPASISIETVKPRSEGERAPKVDVKNGISVTAPMQPVSWLGVVREIFVHEEGNWFDDYYSPIEKTADGHEGGGDDIAWRVDGFLHHSSESCHCVLVSNCFELANPSEYG